MTSSPDLAGQARGFLPDHLKIESYTAGKTPAFFRCTQMIFYRC